jgi:hypothetical protein
VDEARAKTSLQGYLDDHTGWDEETICSPEPIYLAQPDPKVLFLADIRIASGVRLNLQMDYKKDHLTRVWLEILGWNILLPQVDGEPSTAGILLAIARPTMCSKATGRGAEAQSPRMVSLAARITQRRLKVANLLGKNNNAGGFGQQMLSDTEL